MPVEIVLQHIGYAKVHVYRRGTRFVARSLDSPARRCQRSDRKPMSRQSMAFFPVPQPNSNTELL